MLQQVDIDANKHHIQYGAYADFFFKQANCSNNGYAYDDAAYAKAQACGLAKSCMEYIPRCITNIGLYGKHYAKGIKHESEI